MSNTEKDMTEIQIVEAPKGKETKTQVRAALEAQYPQFRVAAIIHDKTENVWRAKLVRKVGRLHHRFAVGGEEEENFPIKGLDPKKVDDQDEPDVEEDEDEENPVEKHDDEEEGAEERSLDDEKPHAPKPPHEPGVESEGESKNPLAEVKHLLDQLEHVLPQVMHALKGQGLEEPGMEMEHDHMPPEAPMGEMAPPRPPRRPPLPAGAGPGGPAPRMAPRSQPRQGPGQLPTFTKRRTQLLEREANVTESQARQELEQEFPDYSVAELKRLDNRYLVTLELRR